MPVLPVSNACDIHLHPPSKKIRRAGEDPLCESWQDFWLKKRNKLSAAYDESVNPRLPWLKLNAVRSPANWESNSVPCGALHKAAIG